MKLKPEILYQYFYKFWTCFPNIFLNVRNLAFYIFPVIVLLVAHLCVYKEKNIALKIITNTSGIIFHIFSQGIFFKT